jgi:hypothetical protein
MAAALTCALRGAWAAPAGRPHAARALLLAAPRAGAACARAGGLLEGGHAWLQVGQLLLHGLRLAGRGGTAKQWWLWVGLRQGHTLQNSWQAGTHCWWVPWSMLSDYTPCD